MPVIYGPDVGCEFKSFNLFPLAKVFVAAVYFFLNSVNNFLGLSYFLIVMGCI